MAIASGFNPIFLKNQGKARSVGLKAREFPRISQSGRRAKKDENQIAFINNSFSSCG